MTLQITVEGLDEIRKMTDPTRLTAALDTAIGLSSTVLRDETKKMPAVSASRTGYSTKGIPVAPKYGGTLRQQIRSRKLGVLMAEVYGGASYTGFVHDGTGKMPARPFFKWMLEDFGGSTRVEEIVTEAIEKMMRL